MNFLKSNYSIIMPASTFKKIANNWEGEKDVFYKIANTCRIANFYLDVYDGNIIIRLDPVLEKEKTISGKYVWQIHRWYYQESIS